MQGHWIPVGRIGRNVTLKACQQWDWRVRRWNICENEDKVPISPNF
jgi:hypothetical protein